MSNIVPIATHNIFTNHQRYRIILATNKDLQQDSPNRPSSLQSEHARCGYCIHNTDKADEKWKCIFCKQIIKEPVQLTDCGHRCCRGCYESRVAVQPDGMVTCPDEDCNYQFDRSKTMIDRAFKKEIDQLPVMCMYKTSDNCQWNGPLNTYQEHLDQAHSRLSCSFCKELFSTNQAVIDHQAKSCSSLFQRCPLAPHCGEELIRQDQFVAHLLTEKHQEATALALIGNYNVPESSDPDQEMETASAHNEIEEEVSDKLSELADQVQKLNDQTVQLSHDFIKLNELYQVASQEVNHLQAACTEKTATLSSLQPKQDAVQKDIEQLKVSLEENQYVSTDGSFMWRVDRVAERMADAQSERQPSIFSPVFYSSPHGHKMRARLYLHGDGNARRTHMSLFFLLMKGDFDALLPWPFAHKVTFCLLDQTESKRHIIDSFRPDVKSSSFQRPTSESNIASGIPKFFPLPMIQQDDNVYVKDDTLFLKILVDLHDTPKMILPYMLALNPGLPNHVQQALVNQEKHKQQQNTANTAAAAQPTPINNCA